MGHISFVHGRQLAIELAEMFKVVLGGRPIRDITIKANCSEACSVTVEFVPTTEDAKGINRVMAKYALVAAPDGEPKTWRDKPPLA